MTEKHNTENDGQKSKSKKQKRLLVILILLLIILFVIQSCLGKIKKDAIIEKEKVLAELLEEKRLSDLRIQDSLRILDSLSKLDTLVVDTINIDSVALKEENAAKKLLADSLAQKKQELEQLRLDSLRRDSLANIDTIAPIAQLSPPKGRYFGEVNLNLSCNDEDCKLFYAVDDKDTFVEGTKFKISKSAKVFYYAQDSSGNKSKIMDASYDLAEGSNKCGSNMVPIMVGAKEVCMDIYEWPNKSGSKPKVFISQEEASKMCADVGKKLCTVDEWQSACMGKKSEKYPYGSRYSPSKCVSAAKELGRSGRKKECRSYYGVYDMSGNAWEWTSTPYEKRAGYVYVVGGAWDSQDQSTCNEKKFSFFPQNQYPFVGFRCCK